MTDVPEHLLWLHERYGAALSAALADRDGMHLAPGAAIAAFARADPTPGLRLTDWLVRTYVEQGSYKFEDVQAGPQSTVGTTLALFVSRRGTLEPDRRNVNLYDSPGALWQAVGGDAPPKRSRRGERDRARAESAILVDDERGIIAVPLTQYAAQWWGRGTRWCTAARDYNAFHDYAKDGPLLVLVTPEGKKAQLHVNPKASELRDAADDKMYEESLVPFRDLLEPIVRWAVDIDGTTIRWGWDLRGDRDMVLRAVRSNPMAVVHIAPALQDDDEVMTIAVKAGWKALASASSRLRDDKALVLEAVRQKGQALACASRRLKADPEVVFAAVRNDPEALLTASNALKGDRTIVMEAVSHFGGALKHVNSALRKDPEVVMAAVKSNGMAFQFASKEFRENRDVVFQAVEQSGGALLHADKTLQDDKEIVLAAVKQSGRAIAQASIRLQKDREIILNAVCQDIDALVFLGTEFSHDREIIKSAVKSHGNALAYACQDLRSDHDVVLAAVRRYGRNLVFASPALKGNREIVMEAIGQDGRALEYAAHEFKDDETVVMASVRQEGTALEHASPAFRDNKEIVLAAVSQAPSAFAFASERLQGDEDVLSLPGVVSPSTAYTYDFSGFEGRTALPSPASASPTP